MREMQRISLVLLVAAVFFLSHIHAGPSGLITHKGKALTSKGLGEQPTLEKIGICDSNQIWEYVGEGYIVLKSNPELVLDVSGGSAAEGHHVTTYTKKTFPDAITNQLWNVITNPDRIETQLTQGFNLYYGGDGLVISESTPAQQFTMEEADACSVSCASHGDPHFSCWDGRRFDFQSANTVLLARFSEHRVYAVQYACGKGVTCNEGIIVHPYNVSDSFQITFAQAFRNGTKVSLPLGTTKYSDIISVTKNSNANYVITIPGAYITYTNYANKYVTVSVTLTDTDVNTPQPSLCMCPPSVMRSTDSVMKNSKNPQKILHNLQVFPPEHEFGSQFIVQYKNETNYQYINTPFTYDPDYTPNYGPYNTTDKNLMANALKLCSVLQKGDLITQCAAFVDADDYYDTCYNDTIATADLSLAQQSIDAYADRCADVAARNGSTVQLPTSAAFSIVYGWGINSMVDQTSGSTSFTIQAKDASMNNQTTGGENFVVTSTGPSALTFTVVDNDDGTYTVSYSPSRVGVYTISVKMDGTYDVAGSPFTITVAYDATYGPATIAYGPGLKSPVPANESVSFTIQARSSSGQNRTVGGDRFDVVFTGGEGDEFTILQNRDNGNGTYTVTYVGREVGVWGLSVSLAFVKVPIQGSPFTVEVVSDSEWNE